MSRDTPKAPTVGHCHCPNPHCGKLAAIRRNKSGKHYAVCQVCGPIYWLTPAGQEFFLNEGTIWGASGAPADIPAWIREGKVAPRAGASPVAEKKSEPAPSVPPEPARKVVPMPQRNAEPVPKAEPESKPATPVKRVSQPWWQF